MFVRGREVFPWYGPSQRRVVFLLWVVEVLVHGLEGAERSQTVGVLRTHARAGVRTESQLVQHFEFLVFDEGVEEVVVDFVGDLVGEAEEMKSTRKGGRSEDEGVRADSKSNEGEEVKEGVLVGDVGKGGWKRIRRRLVNRGLNQRRDEKMVRTIAEGERLD